MINGNILGKCFRSSSSSGNPRISPLTPEYECPQLSLLTVSSDAPTPTKRDRSPASLFHAQPCKAYACLEHSDLLTGTYPYEARPAVKHGRLAVIGWGPGGAPCGHERRANASPVPNVRGTLESLTTSFLSATTLIYAIGAGVTAAAGTRLALQWILDKVSKLSSFPFDSRSRQQVFLVTTSSN